ncbi:MAG: pyridoxine 5'-phosphate synthase [Hyphomicrobiales bacterium]|nr:pyridoxine 5'-phosphate synthase [Hyphomicrobiales bacterium]MDE2115625.1 pyridoxine 5'-phosphate synthase [Hyphomicrobiales bacterium]
MAFLPLRLGVNIDHVATVRNARGGSVPDPCRAAIEAIAAGADGITAHLREDRRHIRDADMEAIRKAIGKPLNFEMAATEEMLAIAIRTQPHAACLVPEKRSERTTEGGLDVVGGHDQVKAATHRLKSAGIRVSLFIEPSLAAIDAAVSIGAPVVELHTGAWAEAFAAGDDVAADMEFARIRAAAAYAHQNEIECHAGHGLNYQTARLIAAVPQIAELNIGHFIIGEAIFLGLAAAVKNMRLAMNEGRAGA